MWDRRIVLVGSSDPSYVLLARQRIVPFPSLGRRGAGSPPDPDRDSHACEARDRKNLYARARAGEIPQFTGVSAPYEAPAAPDVHLDTAGRTVAECVALLVAELRRRGLVA